MAESSASWIRLVIMVVTVGVTPESELDPVTAPTENKNDIKILYECLTLVEGKTEKQ